MIASIKVDRTDPSIKQLLAVTFPEYKGRKITVRPTTYPIDVTSYWSGGSRSYFSCIDLRSMRTIAVPQNGTPFDGGPIAPNGIVVPIGYAIVEHRYNGSSPQTITIHVHPDTITPFLQKG